jgi:hypothetical protein
MKGQWPSKTEKKRATRVQFKKKIEKFQETPFFGFQKNRRGVSDDPGPQKN